MKTLVWIGVNFQTHAYTYTIPTQKEKFLRFEREMNRKKNYVLRIMRPEFCSLLTFSSRVSVKSKLNPSK